MITDHAFRPSAAAAAKCTWLGDCGRPASEHAAERTPRPRGSHISARQLEILYLVAGGLSDREIGVGLHISADTVKTHLRRAYESLGARNRAHAVTLAYRAGLLTPPGCRCRDLASDRRTA